MNYILKPKYWPTFASSVLYESIDIYHDFKYQVQCDISKYNPKTILPEDILDGYPKVKPIKEVFSPRNISWILGKNIFLHLLVDVHPFVLDSLQELQSAEDEDREPIYTSFPNLKISLKRGLIGSLRQAATLFLKWIYDTCVFLYFPWEITTRLLKDHRRKYGKILSTYKQWYKQFVPLYIAAFEAYFTWTLADFTISIFLITYKTIKIEDPAERQEYLFQMIIYQMIKWSLLTILDPFGAVMFGIASNHVPSINIGYNAVDLFLNAIFDNYMLQ